MRLSGSDVFRQLGLGTRANVLELIPQTHLKTVLTVAVKRPGTVPSTFLT